MEENTLKRKSEHQISRKEKEEEKESDEEYESEEEVESNEEIEKKQVDHPPHPHQEILNMLMIEHVEDIFPRYVAVGNLKEIEETINEVVLPAFLSLLIKNDIENFMEILTEYMTKVETSIVTQSKLLELPVWCTRIKDGLNLKLFINHLNTIPTIKVLDITHSSIDFTCKKCKIVDKIDSTLKDHISKMGKPNSTINQATLESIKFIDGKSVLVMEKSCGCLVSVDRARMMCQGFPLCNCSKLWNEEEKSSGCPGLWENEKERLSKMNTLNQKYSYSIVMKRPCGCIFMIDDFSKHGADAKHKLNNPCNTCTYKESIREWLGVPKLIDKFNTYNNDKIGYNSRVSIPCPQCESEIKVDRLEIDRNQQILCVKCNNKETLEVMESRGYKYVSYNGEKCPIFKFEHIICGTIVDHSIPNINWTNGDNLTYCYQCSSGDREKEFNGNKSILVSTSETQWIYHARCTYGHDGLIYKNRSGNKTHFKCKICGSVALVLNKVGCLDKEFGMDRQNGFYKNLKEDLLQVFDYMKSIPFTIKFKGETHTSYINIFTILSREGIKKIILKDLTKSPKSYNTFQTKENVTPSKFLCDSNHTCLRREICYLCSNSPFFYEVELLKALEHVMKIVHPDGKFKFSLSETVSHEKGVTFRYDICLLLEGWYGLKGKISIEMDEEPHWERKVTKARDEKKNVLSPKNGITLLRLNYKLFTSPYEFQKSIFKLVLAVSNEMKKHLPQTMTTRA
ncbi:hypothetical protein DFA_09947 [Cavenderia fasciculata]|uniref:Uncharacterized protein n=1 Tax=Cavenderia fasciculata TaxID=261658 RepID=F4Q8V4_CACFS|nr:uncharacterized protein DFA_09947 [Cavenderia fasciculata]EGG15123.1 hypothetical protein DFA_09947 [Cavenderia fasciculata]|eukprot:XP_004351843.1 hypothetical protein DFA_09947 [Cavenderia fasciculata]